MKYIILFFGLATICNGSYFSGRIIGGIPSAVDDAYAVAVYSARGIGSFPDYSFLSTGTAISEHIVVVSAQAIVGFTDWRVGINSQNREQQLISEVSSASIYDQFDLETLEYNVGVLRVNSRIEKFINLAPGASIFPVLFGIGFGSISEDETLLPSISQQAALHVIDLNECRQRFNHRVVRSTNICVRATGLFANGDQGAPAVDFNRQQVHGIVSFWDNADVLDNRVVLTDFADPEIRAFLLQHLER